MQTIKNQIPNLLTLGNLFCGCLAIKFAFEWDLVMAAYLVGIAAVFDFLDGFAARMLKVSGEMGKQLDSLADMVSFGVVPGVVMFQMMRIVSLEIPYGTTGADDHLWGLNKNIEYGNINEYIHPFSYIAFLICILSAYRLAKFNIDTRQSDQFIGLPTPANAIFICALGWLFSNHIGYRITETPNFFQVYLTTGWLQKNMETFTLYDFPGYWLSSADHENALHTMVNRGTLFITLVAITITFSLLLISELPLFALKFKNFGWVDNKIRYIFLTISLTMLIIFQILAIPFIVILYILLSILNNLLFKQ